MQVRQNCICCRPQAQGVSAHTKNILTYTQTNAYSQSAHLDQYIHTNNGHIHMSTHKCTPMHRYIHTYAHSKHTFAQIHVYTMNTHTNKNTHKYTCRNCVFRKFHPQFLFSQKYKYPLLCSNNIHAHTEMLTQTHKFTHNIYSYTHLQSYTLT